ncbi:DNA-directed RNA polymerase III subunit Rpc5 [Corchorus olitorius]|uniref:DNA-directed RNA polymerase III subunit Rpc5 n=1 Tax=Corchorus olitorius TaxID=93759 RepID=A0A1R3INZ8_9ROSI|nr:DNA-directed RNA polymerase III subunit Rpc5 [Corchorus olitorius]
MDLDDLDELDGPRQGNTRTTKFAPKSSKFAPSRKPKSEPKAETKVEKEQEDIKPVIAELKTEQSVSNGAAKMEIDAEAKEDAAKMEIDAVAKEDVIMNDQTGEEEEQQELAVAAAEEDMVVREIDVFFTPSVDANTQLYVLQYPMRPCWRPYELDERCDEVRVKPATGEVEVDMSVDVDSNNFDKECASRLKMNKQTLSTSWLPSRATGCAVGVLMGDKLHLNPINAVVQLRPSMEHLKPSVSKRKNTVEADAEVTVKVEEHTDEKEVGSSTKKKKKTESSNEPKADDKEFHSSKSDFSAQYLQRMMAEESCPIQFAMNPYDYVDCLCPGANNNNKAQGPSKRFLLSMPLEERLKKLLLEGPPFQRFNALKHFAPDASTEAIFEVLQKHAQLVQGLWVPKSPLLFPGDPLKALARDYVLILFSKNPIITLAHLNGLSTRHRDEVKGILKILAIERPSFKDWKLKENDESFKKLYPDIVQKQEEIWAAGEDNVINHIFRAAKGGPSRTKPGVVIKPEKVVNSDKGERKVAPGAQAGRTMTDEIQKAMPKALKKVFQTHKVCSLQLIRKGLRDLAVSLSTHPKADARIEVRAAEGANAPEHELREVVSQVAVEVHGGLFILRSSPDHPEYDPLREVVINLLRAKEKLKKADVFAAAQLSLKREINNNEYNKIKKGNQSLRKESEAKTQELRDPKTVNQAQRTWAPKGVAGEEDESSWVC